MNLMFFEGKMGKGKTAGMSVIAKDWAERSNATLYSNYGLVGSKPFRSFSDFLDVAQQPSSIVCLDECHNDIDTRDYNTNAVKYFTHIAFYLRKLRCILMMTSPLFDNIEGRVRNVTNILVPVQKDNVYFYYPFVDLESYEVVKMKKIKQENLQKLSSQIFDTYEMVTPLEYPSNREEFKTLLSNLKDVNRNYLESRNRATREQLHSVGI